MINEDFYMRNNNICPVCGVGHLTVEMEYDDVTYKGETKNLPIRFSVCDQCGSETATPVDLRENKRIFNEYKKYFVILCGFQGNRMTRIEIYNCGERE